MEMHAVDRHDVGRFFEGFSDVAVFENSVPDLVGSCFVVELQTA